MKVRKFFLKPPRGLVVFKHFRGSLVERVLSKCLLLQRLFGEEGGLKEKLFQLDNCMENVCFLSKFQWKVRPLKLS